MTQPQHLHGGRGLEEKMRDPIFEERSKIRAYREYSALILFFFPFFFSLLDCFSGPAPFLPDSPATRPIPLPCGVHQRYPMNSPIRAESVLRETLTGRLMLPLLQAQKLDLEQALEGGTPKVHKSNAEKEMAAGTNDYRTSSFFCFFPVDCYSGPAPFPPDSPAT